MVAVSLAAVGVLLTACAMLLAGGLLGLLGVCGVALRGASASAAAGVVLALFARKPSTHHGCCMEMGVGCAGGWLRCGVSCCCGCQSC